MVAVMDDMKLSMYDKCVLEAEMKAANETTASASTIESTRQKEMAMLFIRNSNQDHESYRNHLKASYLDGIDVYPKTLQAAYRVLERRPKDPVRENHENGRPGVAFTNHGTTSNGN
jgi:hypothetical protein